MNFSDFLPELKSFTPVNSGINHLPWMPPRDMSLNSQVLSDVAAFRASPHKWFNTILRQTDVCDLEQVEVPGAIIMLPWGVKIVERFYQLLREEAEQCGYEEYCYPCLIPKNYFKPLSDLIDFDNSTLNVSGNNDIDIALTPTGEYPIYHHWQMLVKSQQDLPKKMYQRAKYFRPLTSAKRSGGSVFLSMEASDVFEFHSAFVDHADASSETINLLSLFQRMAEKTGTFVLWTMRPNWTNRGYLYRWCYGGDALLPSNHSIQVASAYYQGDVFSKRIGISFTQEGKIVYTSQATGAITKRLIFANLFQTMRADGSLCLHPNISPIQLTLITTTCNVPDENIILKINEELKNNNIRYKHVRVENKNQLRKEEKKWYRLGIPLKMVYFGRKDFDKIKLILVRNDTQEELQLDVNEAVKLVKLALQDIENHQLLMKQNNKKNITQCINLDEIKNILQRRHIATMPLAVDPHCVNQIEQLKKGEVLGYYSENKISQCIITGKMTEARAFVSRRI